MKITIETSVSQARRACRDKSKVIRCRQGACDMYDKPDLPNPNTPDQQASRRAWSRGSAAWRELSAESKRQWNAYATGHEHFFARRTAEPLTGYRLYQSAAGSRQILGLELPSDAPTQAPPEVPTRVQLLPSAEADTLRLRIDHRLCPTGFFLVVSMSPATLRASRKPDRRNGRHVRGWGQESTAPLPASGGEIVFTGCRYAVGPGQRFGVWLRVVREADGLSSPEMMLDLIRPQAEAEGDGASEQHAGAMPSANQTASPEVQSTSFAGGVTAVQSEQHSPLENELENGIGPFGHGRFQGRSFTGIETFEQAVPVRAGRSMVPGLRSCARKRVARMQETTASAFVCHQL